MNEYSKQLKARNDAKAVSNLMATTKQPKKQAVNKPACLNTYQYYQLMKMAEACMIEAQKYVK